MVTLKFLLGFVEPNKTQLYMYMFGDTTQFTIIQLYTLQEHNLYFLVHWFVVYSLDYPHINWYHIYYMLRNNCLPKSWDPHKNAVVMVILENSCKVRSTLLSWLIRLISEVNLVTLTEKFLKFPNYHDNCIFMRVSTFGQSLIP